jgi:hypothetical protein
LRARHRGLLKYFEKIWRATFALARPAKSLLPLPLNTSAYEQKKACHAHFPKIDSGENQNKGGGRKWAQQNGFG